MGEIESFELDNELYLNNCVSCIGGREENQDTCGMTMTRRGLLVVVCDGMGGMNGGGTASKIAVQEITNFIDEPAGGDDVEDDNRMALIGAINSANSRILEESKANHSLEGMGTTVVALLINEEKASIAYVGDSRIYQIRKGRKVFRTFDHSMVFEMVKKKILTEEQARLSSQSNVILRALGQKTDIDVDSCDLSYDKGDIFLLCTDGIWGTMPEKELIKRVSLKKHPRVVTETLAMNVNNDGISKGGGHDNLTAAMIKTTLNSKQRNKMESRLKKLIIILVALLAISIICNFIPRNNNRSDNKSVDKIEEIDMSSGGVES